MVCIGIFHTWCLTWWPLHVLIFQWNKYLKNNNPYACVQLWFSVKNLQIRFIWDYLLGWFWSTLKYQNPFIIHLMKISLIPKYCSMLIFFITLIWHNVFQCLVKLNLIGVPKFVVIIHRQPFHAKTNPPMTWRVWITKDYTSPTYDTNC